SRTGSGLLKARSVPLSGRSRVVYAGSARLIAGLRSKKPQGTSLKPVLCTGMTGQSSSHEKNPAQRHGENV
ncbi:hypothetical protein NW839_11220, partial [Synechococcus sp. R5-15]